MGEHFHLRFQVSIDRRIGYEVRRNTAVALAFPRLLTRRSVVTKLRLLQGLTGACGRASYSDVVALELAVEGSPADA